MEDRLLKKSDIVFLRDKNGDFIPQKVEIDFKDKNLKVLYEQYDIILKEMIKKRDIIGEDQLQQQVKIVEQTKQDYLKSGDVKEIYIKPITKSEIMYLNMTLKDDNGELYRLNSEGKKVEDQDAYIISKYCYNPSFTFDEAKEIKENVKDNIIEAILIGSGYFKDNHIKQTKDKIESMNEEFEKKKQEIIKDKNYKSFISFMHEQGYNMFNIGLLTQGEINKLIEAYNERHKK